MPASDHAPPRALAGYIFGCTEQTMTECLTRNLFGSSTKCSEEVATIMPGTPLFLFNFGRRELHGGFEAASCGGLDLVPAAFGGRFPSQVKVRRAERIRTVLVEDEFREAIWENYYDGHKFHFKLSQDQVAALKALFLQHRQPGVGKRFQTSLANSIGKRPRLEAGVFMCRKDKASRSTVSRANTILPLDRGVTCFEPNQAADPGGMLCLPEGCDDDPQAGLVGPMAISNSEFIHTPVNLEVCSEERTTVVLGPLPTDCNTQQLVQILDSLGLEGQYNFFLVRGIIEDDGHYCFLNFRDAGGVRGLASRCQGESWIAISGQRFADNPKAGVWYWSLQGPEDLVLSFHAEAQWELEGVAPKDSSWLGDNIPQFFDGFGATIRARMCSPHGAGGKDRVPMEKMGLVVGTETVKPFEWQTVACAGVKTEDGAESDERIRKNAFLYFKMDLEKLSKKVENQKRDVVRSVKLKYKPQQGLKAVDPKFHLYESIFKEMSIEIDNMMDSMGVHHPRLQ
ncbi:unnamed protein product [Ostreobium quekettii]|uniref:DCD domain-containing protein n=1 Tax=Ostreobium quekettii TaxID=121088 RepID=A0A8S1IWB9_9CHLO|nr:unnamed protein product [Ostreobium quekettii]|eukprot:evm.model.scf_1291.4 EVM.evm.TU.scf_1291.4   scf_1291:39936-42087(-)